jgi:hypothetical protein
MPSQGIFNNCFWEVNADAEQQLMTWLVVDINYLRQWIFIRLIGRDKEYDKIDANTFHTPAKTAICDEYFTLSLHFFTLALLSQTHSQNCGITSLMS